MSLTAWIYGGQTVLHFGHFLWNPPRNTQKVKVLCVLSFKRICKFALSLTAWIYGGQTVLHFGHFSQKLPRNTPKVKVLCILSFKKVCGFCC